MATNPTIISTIRIARRTIIAAKLEAGSPADPPATIDYSADSIEVHDVEFTPHVEEFERKVRWPNLSQRPALKGITYGELSFTIDMFGNGTNQPFLARFLRAAGFQEKTESGIYYYVPRSDKGEYLTIYFNYAGILYKLAGAQGDIEFSTSVGNPLQMKVKYTGKLVEVKDETLPNDVAGNQILPPVFKGNPVYFPEGSKSPYTYEVSFGFGAKVIPVKASNDATGVVHAQIVERDPKATIKFQAGLIANYDFFTAYKNGTLLSCDFTVGSEDGNKIHVTMPRVQISEYKEPEEDGLVAMELGLRLVSYDGDDELKISFE